jgi:hypothetical protein
MEEHFECGKERLVSIKIGKFFSICTAAAQESLISMGFVSITFWP